MRGNGGPRVLRDQRDVPTRTRPRYWAGFALFGVGYLTLILGPWCTTHLAPSLITETALKALQARYGPYSITQGAVDGMGEQVRYAPDRSATRWQRSWSA